jgi:hypothetical protein
MGSLHRYLLLTVLLLSGLVSPAMAQQILLDEQVLAGELKLYPVYKNEQNYYYLPNKPRLALNEAGLPQFSFIRFVRNSETGAEDSSTSRTTEGGGIVTALIELGVSEDQRNEAQRELQSLVPGAQIMGPVTYDAGKFSLNSVFADTNGDRTEQVLGIGTAPLMEGSKAAISLDLTNKGAQQLWASFDMPTPNVTFHFEMQFDGLLSPKQVNIEADYEKIYSHHSFNVGATGQVGKVVLGAEIDAAFSDLHREQAIKITSVNPDAQMDELTQTANKFIMDTIFKPMNENNQKLPGIQEATGAPGESLLDKASGLLKEARETADHIRGKDTATETDAEQCEAEDVSSGAPDAKDKPESETADTSKPGTDTKAAQGTEDSTCDFPVKSRGRTEVFDVNNDIAYLKEITRVINLPGGCKGVYHAPEKLRQVNKAQALQDAKEYRNAVVLHHQIFEARPNAASLHNIALSYRYADNLPATRAYYQLFLDFIEASGITDRQERVEIARKFIEEQSNKGSNTEESASSSSKEAVSAPATDEESDTVSETPVTATEQAANSEDITSEAETDNSNDKAKLAETTPPAAKKSSCTPKKATPVEDNRPVMSIVARYQFRREKQSGTFRLSLNKYTSSSHNDNFDENIGDLSQLKNDERFFRTVNLDDDLAYDQREIVVMLNGLNSSDFDNFINFASVKLRKRHESGAETIDDVRIDKANIDRTGSKFILLYGNKGDSNRQRWLDYEFQTTWSFAGGHEEGDTTFQPTNGEAIALSPPIERRSLQIEADPDLLAAANVRAVDVKVFWTIGDQTDSEQVLLRLPNTSASIHLLTPGNSFSYEFEITWMRANGLPDLRSGRLSGSSSMLFVDNLPDD